MSIWLVITAASRSQKILCTILLMVNAVSYLLAFSMGSLGVFVVACLAMLVLSPAEKRMDLFLLLVQTAVVALIVGAVSVKGFGDDVTGSFLPMIMLIVGCAAACVLEIFVREKLVARLADKGKLLIVCRGGCCDCCCLPGCGAECHRLVHLWHGGGVPPCDFPAGRRLFALHAGGRLDIGARHL